MSTGPGPTRKADGTADASVDDIADLLVEDETPFSHGAKEEVSEDSLEVMLETPGPALASSFMPPPPSPMDDVGEEGESNEEGAGSTNLAYEDLLAKLVLPAKPPEPEPEMPEPVGSLPLPEANSSVISPLASTPAPSLFRRPSSQSLQIAPPAEERTLVTENPLVAEEQEAAFREGRAVTREPPHLIHDQQQPMSTEPLAVPTVNGAAKSRLFYLMAGGALVLFGMFLAVVVLKLLMPTPASPPPAVVVPAPPPPPLAAPAHVEPLPPSAPPAAAANVPVTGEPEAIPPTAEPAVPVEPEKAAPRSHKTATHSRAVRPAAPKVAAPKPAPTPRSAPAPKATAPKATPAPAPKPAKATGKKPSKGSGYADPFDN